MLWHSENTWQLVCAIYMKHCWNSIRPKTKTIQLFFLSCPFCVLPVDILSAYLYSNIILAKWIWFPLFVRRLIHSNHFSVISLSDFLCLPASAGDMVSLGALLFTGTLAWPQLVITIAAMYVYNPQGLY